MLVRNPADLVKPLTLFFGRLLPAKGRKEVSASREGDPETDATSAPTRRLSRERAEDAPGRRGRLAPGRGAALLAVLGGLLLGGFALWLYVRTLAPTVLYYDPAGMYDSLMLQVKAAVLGIPNPTGYPTYIMLAHLFTYLPVEGGVAYRVNLASAVFGALAVAGVFAVCRLLTGRLAPAAAGALLFALGPAFWSQAVITEVYTLNVLFIVADLSVLLLWRRTRRDRYLLLFAFLMGLTMTHHMTSGLVLPAAALFVALTDWRKLTEWRLLLKGAGLFLLGLLPYAYLPVRAAMDPPLNEWDPSTPERFFALVTGRGFESRMFAFPWEEVPDRLALYASLLGSQFNPLFLIVAAVGALYLSYRRDLAALGMLLSLYLGWLVYALGYNIRDVWVYFIPTYLVVAIFAASGFGAALDVVARAGRAVPEVLRLRGVGAAIGGGLSAVAVAALSVLMVYLPFSGFRETYEQVDMSENYHGLHVINAVAENAAKDATVLQNNGVLFYLQYVSGDRPDLKVVDPFPAGGWQSESPVWVEAARESLHEGRRTYILFPAGTAEENESLFFAAGYALVPDESGLFYEVTDAEHDPVLQKLINVHRTL